MNGTKTEREVRHRPQRSFEGTRRVLVECKLVTCPSCGERLVQRRSWHTTKTIQTLNGAVFLAGKSKTCKNTACTQFGQHYFATGLCLWSLPHSTYGLDVLVLIAWQYDHEQRTLVEIQRLLNERGVAVNERNVGKLYRRFQRLLNASRESVQTELSVTASNYGGLILALDALYLEGCPHPLYVLFEVQSSIPVVARQCEVMGEAELITWLRPYQTLPFQVLAILSGEEPALLMALKACWPDAPHLRRPKQVGSHPAEATANPDATQRQDGLQPGVLQRETVSSYLQSKTSIPRVSKDLINRQRLYGLLATGLQRRLTLVCTAAGFGKTTLVASWIVQKHLPSAWISLDESDQDFTVFFNHLVFAVSKYLPELATRYQNLFTRRVVPSIRAAMDDLITELSTSQQNLIIVLDDYHQIKSDSIHEAVSFLINHLAPQMHVVILSRAVPPINLSCWRIKNYLLEIDTDDMRLTLDEVQQFLNIALRFPLTSSEIAALNRSTEGWITGMKLAAMNIQKAGDSAKVLGYISGQSRYIADYLMAEVLVDQPPTIREFLFSTSILERMCASLCNDLCGITNSQSILEQLEKKNLFITLLDQQRTWYRYNPVFKDFLAYKLESDRPGHVIDLHKKACQWFRDHNLPELAFPHAILGKLNPLAVALINQIAFQTWRKGQYQTLVRWLENLPLVEIEKYPDLVLIYIQVESPYRARDLIDRFDTNRIVQDLPDDERNRFLGRLAILRGNFALRADDMYGVEKAIRDAQALLSPGDWQWQSNLFFLKGWIYERRDESHLMEEAYRSASIICGGHEYGGSEAIVAITYLANHFFAKGYLERAAATCQEALSLTVVDEYLHNLIGIHHLLLGAVLFHRSELAAAEVNIKKGLELIGQGIDMLWRLDGLYLLAEIKLAHGKTEQTQEILEELQRWYELSDSKEMLESHFQGLYVRLRLAMGNSQQPSNWSMISSPDVQINPGYRYYDFNLPFLFTIGFDRLTFCRYLLAIQDYGQAKVHLDKWLPEYRKGVRLAELVEALILSSFACHRLAQPQAAGRFLVEAICLAQPERYIQLFREELSLLKDVFCCIQPHHWTDFVQVGSEEWTRMAAFLEALSPGQDLAARIFNKKVVSLLTLRERDIMLLISQGLSNAEVGRELCIAKDTLRTHIKRINRKLEAKNRTQAVYRAKELGLLN